MEHWKFRGIVAFLGRICGKIFYAMSDCGIAIFSLFVIDDWKYIFEAIIFIHAPFIHQIKVF